MEIQTFYLHVVKSDAEILDFGVVANFKLSDSMKTFMQALKLAPHLGRIFLTENGALGTSNWRKF